MTTKKVLFINQEITPFVPESKYANEGRFLPQVFQDAGCEIRTFSPRWGIINERRNQLHEVIRLSGMNLIIDDTDHPLIIKVASIAAARMQIYFIDNEDLFFKRGMTTDKDGNEYADNGERAIFYARGVLETVKKLRWVPDIIYCNGWITSLVPLYVKKAYAEEPAYRDCKVISAIFAEEFKQQLGEKFCQCIPFRDIKQEDIDSVRDGKSGHDELMKLAAKYSDGVIIHDKEVNKEITAFIKELGIPKMQRVKDDKAYHEKCLAFFDKVLEKK